jgi:hypothetical protein
MPAVPPEIAQIITTKKLQYCRFADTQKWERFSEIALPECTFEYWEGGKVIVDQGFTYSWPSTEGFTSFFSGAFKTLQTMHLVSPGEFTYISGDEIEAIFPVVYHSALAKGAESTHGVTGTGGGHYFERYKLQEDGDWLMASCRMDRIYEQSS